jgi:hypothetical protein
MIVFWCGCWKAITLTWSVACCCHLLNAQYLQVRCKWWLFFVILDFARGPVV